MKRYSKFFAIILALILVLTTTPAAFAAGVEPGKTASVSFSFNDIYGVDGTFSYSNASILSNISYSNSGNMAGKVNNDVAYFYNSESTDFTITINAKVSSSAKSGDTCQITFTYRTSDANGDMTGWQTMTKTITVEGHACTDSNKDHKCDSCGTKLTSCNDGNKDHKCDSCGAKLTSCNDGNKDHKCDTCGAKLTSCVDSNNDLKCDICGKEVDPPIDYTELDRQLKIAGELNKDEYTEESWNTFTKVLEKAKDVRKNGNQSDVDAAAKELEDAISKLVKMDYSRLLAALESAKSVGNETVAGLIERLIAAIEAANNALDSNDQDAVDAATTELENVIAELEKALNEMNGVPVDTEPSSPFCNISWHNILLVLLIISAILNVVLVVVIVIPVVKKKKQRQ